MIAAARRAAVDALAEIDGGGLDMGSAIARVRKTLSDERDRALLLEVVTGTLRMQAAIDYQLASRVSRPLAKLDAAVLRVLRMSAFQLIYLIAPASISGHSRRCRADASSRQVERGGSDQRRAARALARPRVAGVAASPNRSSITSSIVHSHPGGSSSDGSTATANARRKPGWCSITSRRRCASPSTAT